VYGPDHIPDPIVVQERKERKSQLTGLILHCCGINGLLYEEENIVQKTVKKGSCHNFEFEYARPQPQPRPRASRSQPSKTCSKSKTTTPPFFPSNNAAAVSPPNFLCASSFSK
jgi:hypothetical protein